VRETPPATQYPVMRYEAHLLPEHFCLAWDDNHFIKALEAWWCGRPFAFKMQVDGHCQRGWTTDGTETKMPRPLANHLRPGIKKGNGHVMRKSQRYASYFRPQVGTHPRWRCGTNYCISPCSLTTRCFLVIRWCVRLFKNRSDNDIKNKWYSMMRKQKRISDQLLNEFAPMATGR
jgi:hypothetical protein